MKMRAQKILAMLTTHSVANIVVDDEHRMTAIELSDGRRLEGITEAGMSLNPLDHSEVMLRIAITGKMTVNGMAPVEAFKKKMDEAPKIITPFTPPIVNMDGKKLQ